MLSVARTGAKDANAPTICEIARAVPRGSTLQLGENALETLRKQRDDIGAELNAVCAAVRDPRGAGNKAAIPVLQAQLAPLEEKIATTRAKVMELRRERAKRVAVALASRELDAAERLVAAGELLTKAYSELRDICEEIRRAGDPEQPHFFAPAIGLVAEHAHRIIRLSK